MVELQTGNTKFKRDPWTTLNWLMEISRLVSPAPLGKQRSRDPNDDPYLACALASGAQFIILRDPDLLDVGKPFGIQIVTLRQMLNRLLSHA